MDLAAGRKDSLFSTGIAQKFDSYTQGNVPVYYNPTSSTTIETLDPYQIVARKLIENYFNSSTGQYISPVSGGGPYALVSMFVPFYKIFRTFGELEEGLLWLGLGQTLRMVIKTSDKSECVLQCITSGSGTTVPSDYGITKMGILMNYIQLQQPDVERILKARIEMPFLNYVSYQQVNLLYSVGVNDKIRNLYVGFFSNMNQ